MRARTGRSCRRAFEGVGIGQRQSFALDMIEPVRPEVDAFVLDMLERRSFRKAEFTETEEGHCLKGPRTR